MSSTGAGYDLSATTYSPDGRIFQVGYADKAVELSGTAVGVRCNDGIVLGVEKIKTSKMLKPGSNRRIHKVDLHVGIAMTGYNADSRQLINRCLEECKHYRSQFGVPMPPSMLADHVAQFMHMFTCYHYLRPFGVCCMIAGFDERSGEYELYKVEPSGVYFRYYGCAAGKGKRSCSTDLERVPFADMTCADAMKDVAKLIEKSYDAMKDKEFELEMACICTSNDNEIFAVSDEVRLAAQTAAKAEIEQEEDDDDDD